MQRSPFNITSPGRFRGDYFQPVRFFYKAQIALLVEMGV
jgi:hypothetical protein